MEHIKRPLNDYFTDYDNSKRHKLQTTTHESIGSLTCFEDICNEVIYDIFEYLDYFHVYNAFFDLNIRFHQLLTHSNLPIKIDLSHLSKSAWKRFNANIIEYHMDRINGFRTSNPCIIDLAFTTLMTILPFNRLKNLTLENIEYTHLENLLTQLVCLSNLTSLTISTIDNVFSKANIYRQIFRLPALKYCKISWSGWRDGNSLPECKDQYSPIEYLIITTSINVQELNAFLSYVPRLRRLSILLERHWAFESRKCLAVCNELSHLEMRMDNIGFPIFEQILTEIIPTTKLTHLTLNISNPTDVTYLNAKKWEQLIINHLPNLQIFDIQCDIASYNDTSAIDIEKQFLSSFWITRQWSFSYNYFYKKFTKHTLLCSTDHSRKKQYILYQQPDDQIPINSLSSNLNSIQQIDIHNEKCIFNCTNYFINAKELHFKSGFSASFISIGNLLDRIVPLKQITKLVIECHHFSLKKMIDLLSYSPNVHTLIFESMPLYKDDSLLLKENEFFRKVSQINSVKRITFKDRCDLEKLKLLVTLCPHVQYLTIHTFAKIVEPVIRFLLDKNNQNTRHLYSLNFSRASKVWLLRVDQLLKSERLVDDYTLHSTDSQLYLWW